MKKIVIIVTQPIIIVLILALLLIWNALNANHSVDLLYLLLGVSVGVTAMNYFGEGKGSSFFGEITHLLMFIYLAFAMLVIGSSISTEFIDLLFYILLLLCVWFGLVYTALKIKKLLKL